jgi:hypothetical protein
MGACCAAARTLVLRNMAATRRAWMEVSMRDNDS